MKISKSSKIRKSCKSYKPFDCEFVNEKINNDNNKIANFIINNFKFSDKYTKYNVYALCIVLDTSN